MIATTLPSRHGFACLIQLTRRAAYGETMQPIVMEIELKEENFDEEAYLIANPDVKAAVDGGAFESGLAHFMQYGCKEKRKVRSGASLADIRRKKLERLRNSLRRDMEFTVEPVSGKINYLTQVLREESRITDTNNVSGLPYVGFLLDFINVYNDGIILDCGAGRRPEYYSNVVNFEIVDYDTTDVLGVGEHLPFLDNTFDAVISIAVLEHVRDPMRCANEISRVLRPGGRLLCQMPLLAPLHGYPHHYFNATHQGLRRLFEDNLEIENISVPLGLHPVIALQWIVQSWANGLSGEAKRQFLEARMSDFMVDLNSLVGRQFVAQLPEAQQFELACGNMIEARKPM
jgi:hypothetical protein